MSETLTLAHKAVVITGSGRGIGAACAELAASLGAHVVVNDIDPASASETAERIVAAGGVAHAHPADIADQDAARGLVDACVERFGTIDGLVNNAALMSLGELQDHDADRLRRLLDVNVVAGFNCAAAAITHMLRQGSGSIVNVTSGAHFGLPQMSDYAATKGAVASMTYAWAADLVGTGVRVNALSPLATGAMVSKSKEYFVSHGMSDVRMDAPEPHTNAPAVAYLLSDRAASVHGQIVRSDGTQLSLVAHPAVVKPALARESWTADDVAAAFDETLAARQSPLGIAWADEPPHLKAR